MENNGRLSLVLPEENMAMRFLVPSAVACKNQEWNPTAAKRHAAALINTGRGIHTEMSIAAVAVTNSRKG